MADGERFIDDVIDAYAEVHGNLVVHDARYPAPEVLRSRVREGNVAFEGEISEESPGSRLIEEALLDDRPGPVHLQVWAGTSTIARALLSIGERHRGTPEWESVRASVSAKAVITKFDSHLSGYSADELRGMGFQVWTDPQAPGEWISEGDTTNMLNLFANGLRGHEHPSRGGWGGRAVRTSDGPNEWSVRNAEDRTPDGHDVPEYTVTRWFADAQRDFAARLRWTVTPSYGQANHHPAVAVSPGVDVVGVPGESLVLTATATDPDGDTVTCRWWQYREAGTFPGCVPIADADTPVATVHIPDDAVTGQTVHLVIEVRDDAELPLKAYQRVIVTIDDTRS